MSPSEYRIALDIELAMLHEKPSTDEEADIAYVRYEFPMEGASAVSRSRGNSGLLPYKPR